MITRKRDCNGDSGRHKRLLIGLSLAAILVSSVIPVYFKTPAAHAEETFKTFDGDDSIQVPSSAELQLPKFTVEVRFKLDKTPSERGYFVSKDAGTGMLDHNYALFVTKDRGIGGGFMSADGQYYDVYSWGQLWMGTWHVATLQYDGSKLILEIDGKLARTLTVGKSPETSGTGPLMIGKNSNGANGFFVGDMDYVRIIDGRNNNQVYFNDFGTSPVNSPPDALNDWGWTYKNTAKTLGVLSNDSDPDGDALAITSVAEPFGGSVTENGDGTITYTPDLDFVGTDTYRYTISDGRGGTDAAYITIQVRDIMTNNPPNAVNDSTGTTKNTQVTTNVLSNDSDPDGDALAITSVTDPAKGTATKNSGTITYTPDTGFVGTDTYQYTISDGALTDTATVTVSVSDTAPTNNPPNAVNDSTGTTKNTQVTTNVLSNDSDPDGDALMISSVTNPPHGSAVKNSGGTITYTPDTGFVGTDSYQYTISDGKGAYDIATVTVSVSDTAPPPGTDCSAIPVSNFKGAVFEDPILSKREKATPGVVQTEYVTKTLGYMKMHGLNTVRVAYFWESYVNNPSVFMQELDLIAKTAQENNMCVVFA
ncbi:MAG: Ig-like domain-containing protein, partial [Nitrososphaera sp.]